MTKSFQIFFWQYALWILICLLLFYLSLHNLDTQNPPSQTQVFSEPENKKLVPKHTSRTKNSDVINLDDQSNEADSIFSQMHTTTFNIEGYPKLIVEAQSFTHFLKEDTSHLIEPKVTVFRNSPNPWVITSKTGLAKQGIRQIQFHDSVHIQHQADSAHPDTQIDTSTLTVEPEQSIAYTDAPITLIQPGTQISATGMHADLNSGEIHLLSNARGKYVSHPKQ